jgi:hypothetical protein
MANLKHVGRLTSNKRKVVVAFRVLPNDPEHCLIVDTATLTDDDHTSLMTLVESSAGQSVTDLATAMERSRLRDGSVMLSSFHVRNQLKKVRTDEVELTPNTTTAVLLSEVNQIIAEQQGVTVADLAIKGDRAEEKTVATSREVPAPAVEAEAQAARVNENTNGVLTDEDLAAQYRSQADALFKEAKRLREQAEELVPTKKKKAEAKA